MFVLTFRTESPYFNNLWSKNIFEIYNSMKLEIRRSIKKEKSSRYVPIFSMSNIQIL